MSSPLPTSILCKILLEKFRRMSPLAKMASLRLCFSIANFVIYCIASLVAVQAQQQQQSAAAHLNLSPAFKFSPLAPVNMNVSNIAIHNLDDGYFFPILSSPSFKTWNSSADSPGFSLGFYFWHDPKSYNLRLYLAVCAGSSGSRFARYGVDFAFSSLDYYMDSSLDFSYRGLISKDGFVVPVWFANLDRPIEHADNAFLVLQVIHENTTNVAQSLQLKAGNGEALWSVKDAAKMEMSNSGSFFIYSSTGALVFTTSTSLTDTLMQGQKLSVGMQLTSNDSAYRARVEKGGLPLYLNSMLQAASLTSEAAPPYWVFPFFRNPDPNSPHPTLNQLMLHPSPPNYSCNHQSYIPPYISVTQDSFWGQGSLFNASCG